MARIAFIDQTPNRLWDKHDHGRDAVSINVVEMLRYMTETHGYGPIRDGATWYMAECHLLANRLIDQATGCWLFNSPTSRQTGMKVPTRANLHLVVWFPSLRRQESPHRMAARLWLGLDGNDRSVVVRHRCDRPHCFNPAHLELGTQRDNVHDMMRRGRARFYTKANSRLDPDKVREIRRRLALGERKSDLARHFGVSAPTITAVSNGTTWRDVDNEG